MEYICEVCKKAAEVFCTCDTSHQFCYRDFVDHHQKTMGKHNEIIVSKLQKVLIDKKLKSRKFSTNLKKFKNN